MWMTSTVSVEKACPNVRARKSGCWLQLPLPGHTSRSIEALLTAAALRVGAPCRTTLQSCCGQS